MTKNEIKNLINELLKKYDLTKIPTVFYSKYKNNEEIMNFINDEQITFGKNISQRLFKI